MKQDTLSLEPGSPSLCELIHFMCGRSMEGESLEGFGHVLDIDDVSWTWFWISGWGHPALNSIEACMDDAWVNPTTNSKPRPWNVDNVQYVTKIFLALSLHWSFTHKMNEFTRGGREPGSRLRHSSCLCYGTLLNTWWSYMYVHLNLGSDQWEMWAIASPL